MSTLETYYQDFLASLPPDSPYRTRPYEAAAFGDSPELADQLGHLIVAGIKTATCSAVWSYEAEGEPIPELGLLTIILDGRGQPLCIIETTEVTIRRFDEVDAAFAYAEGEDDRSLAAWRAGHLRFFTRTLAPIGRTPTPDMPLVCERFRVIFSQS